MVAPAKSRITAAEFWQLANTTDQRLELINGDIIEMATPIPDHQEVVGDVFVFLKQVAKTLGGRAFVAPLEVYLDEENIPQPDVMWVAPNSKSTVGDKHLEGPPDLIVEVFSPSTKQRDKDTKFKLYQRHGVREYWMFDPADQSVEVWQWMDGRFALNGVFDKSQTFTSAVLGGQTVEVKTLFGG